MIHPPLALYFALAFFYHLTLPILPFTLPVLCFAPVFSLSFSRKSLFFSLWTSFFIGLFFDLRSASTPLGFYPLLLIIVTLIIYRFRIYFSEKQPLVFIIYTALYSFVYTLVFSLLHVIIEPRFTPALIPLIFDLLFFSLIDSFYHLALFFTPIALTQWILSKTQKNLLLGLKRVFSKISFLQEKGSK
jgi:hypothetical protein